MAVLRPQKQQLGSVLLRTFGRNVRQHREARGWVRRELVEASGISPRHLVSIEQGQVPKLSLEIAHKVARALGKSVDELCGVR